MDASPRSATGGLLPMMSLSLSEVYEADWTDADAVVIEALAEGDGAGGDGAEGGDGSGTADDTLQTLTGFTRQIIISDVAPPSPDLRMVTVLITYQAGTATRTYSLSAYISRFA